jgi:hypothetical protein
MMHGYGDTFTTAELDRNDRLLQVGPGWARDLRATGARIAVLRPDSRLAYARVSPQGWSIEHRSDTLEMLSAPRPRPSG